MRRILVLATLLTVLNAATYTDTYNRAWRLASENYTLSQNTYRTLLQQQKLSPLKKAKVCLNMGNDSLRHDDVDTAIRQYTQGLKYDAKNPRLKHNLELAKKIQKEKKNPTTERRDQKQSQKQKQAEQQLNAFKDQEIKDMQQNMQQRRKKYNVEKDW